jgi:hypothetical protein
MSKLKRLLMKTVFSAHIENEDELYDFAAWAFGDNFQNIELGLQFMHSWNKIHGDKLTLTPNGDIFEDAKKMVNLWKQYLEASQEM